MPPRPATVAAYIGMFPPAVRERLSAIRDIIHKTAPKATESISYGMPAYKYEGALLYFAGYERHTGLYAMPSAQKAFAEELKGYKTGKGSVQFPHDRPLPVSLIRKIIRFRIKENEAKALAKANSKK